jgi:hypothetical protein
MHKRKQFYISWFLTDIILVCGLIFFSVFLTSYFINAKFIQTGYPDFFVHAFRAEFLKEFGLLSWNHIWSNGANMFQSYQIIPHILTVFMSFMTGESIPRSMILLLMLLTYLLPVVVYCILRIVRISPFPSFVASLCTLSLSQYWGSFSDYSIVFGFFFFPIIIFFGFLYQKHIIRWVFPVLVGSTVFVHATLFFHSLVLYGVLLFAGNRKIFSIGTFLEGLLLVISSLWLTLPLITHDSYAYISTFLSSKEFLSFFLSRYPYHGLGLPSFIGILCIPLLFFIHETKTKYSWSFVLIVYSCITLGILYAGTVITLPSFIGKFQITRAAPYTGIALSFLIALITHYLWETKHVVLKGVITLFLFVIMYESIVYASMYIPDSSLFEDPVQSYRLTHPDILLSEVRILPPDIGSTSYALMTEGKYPVAYMSHMESNYISSRLSALIYYQEYPQIIPDINLLRLDDYLKATGTSYVLFDEFSPFTKSLLLSGVYIDKGTTETRNNKFHMFEVPWKTSQAFVIDPSLDKQIEEFSLHYDITQSEEGQTQLDDYIHTFASVLNDKKTIPLNVVYPTPTKIEISVPFNRPSNTVVLLESYSKGFQAKIDNQVVHINPAGPHFMQLILPSSFSGLPVKIVLEHHWPMTFWITVFSYVAVFVFSCIFDLFSVIHWIKKPNHTPVIQNTII